MYKQNYMSHKKLTGSKQSILNENKVYKLFFKKKKVSKLQIRVSNVALALNEVQNGLATC